MAALRAEIGELRRAARHYAPRLLAEAAALAALVLFLTAFLAAAAVRGA